jgi:hypothetical protein
MVAYVSNLNYLGGKDQDDHGSRPAWAKISKTTSQQQQQKGHGGIYLSFQLHQRPYVGEKT